MKAVTRPPAGVPGKNLFRNTALLALVFASYIFLDWLSYIHPLEPFNITPWNPQPAVLIAFLMLRGQRWLPVVFLIVATVEFILRGAPVSIVGTLAACIVLTLCYGAIAHALVRQFPVSHRLDASRDMLRLVGVVTAGALVTGSLYVTALAVHDVGAADEYLYAVLSFWIGDSVGILVALPLILMLVSPERRLQFRALLTHREILFQGAAIALTLWLVFGQEPVEHFKFFYVLFLPLVWAAARHGMPGAALAAALIQIGVMFAVHTTYQPDAAFELQGLLIALAITGFFLGVTVDERQRASEELRRSLKLAAAGEMAAALAHELNQPLAALTTYASATQLLLRPGADSPPGLVDDTLQKLVTEAKRAGDVVRRLRDFFRSGARNLERIDVKEVVEEVLAGFAARAAAQHIVVGYDVREPIPAVLADPVQIQVVVRNLVGNALDAIEGTADARTVTVSLYCDKAFDVTVEVADSGPGIPEEQLEHLFEPFATSKATGMGVGLAISRAIVEAHGGRMEVRTSDEGAVLSFSLPASSAHD